MLHLKKLKMFMHVVHLYLNYLFMVIHLKVILLLLLYSIMIMSKNGYHKMVIVCIN
jgi:hypothetical protein